MKIVRNETKIPENSFWETGFYFGENWRYTGKWGLLWHNTPMKNLPKPYDGIESINDPLLLFPIHLTGQIGVSCQRFAKNLFTRYNGNGSLVKDGLSLPLALADFFPAILGSFITVLSPILVPGYLIALGIKNSECDFGVMLSCTLALLPLIAICGAVHAAMTTALMFTKAGLETVFSLLTVASIPLKAVATFFSLLCKSCYSETSDKTNSKEAQNSSPAPEDTDSRSLGLFKPSDAPQLLDNDESHLGENSPEGPK